MPDFEDLRMIELIEKFRKDIEEINSTRKLNLIKQAGEKLQSVYNFYVTAENSYAKQEELFKSLFSSFNYAAVIVNNAIRNGGLVKDDNELLNECVQIMLKCCAEIIKQLKQ